MFSVCVYVCVFFCVCVQVEALRWANHPFKESYRLSFIKKLRKLSPKLQKREQAPTCGSNEEEKKYGVTAHHTSKESYRLWMIKKLRNQPYAPKWEQEEKKKQKKQYGVTSQTRTFL
jgi:hypothetical protein